MSEKESFEEVCAAILRQSTPEAIAKIDARMEEYFRKLNDKPDISGLESIGSIMARAANNTEVRVSQDS